MTEPIGRIAGLWRYPVKSMQGEPISEATIGGRGVLGDRGYALIDRETGYVASAKHPRRWARLLECQAVYVREPGPDGEPPPVRITLPGGVVLRSDQPETEQLLSEFLGRPVRLATTAPADLIRESDRTPPEERTHGAVVNREPIALAAPPGTFLDYGPLHFITTATIERLRELHPSGAIDSRRFRPNVIVTPMAGEPGFLENRWLGRCLELGRSVRIRVIDPCPRCVVTTLRQDGLPLDRDVLRIIARHNSAASVTRAPGVPLPAVAGAYAAPLESGRAIEGDAVALI